MIDFLRLTLSFLIAFFIGWSVLSIIFYKRPLLFLPEKAALSYPLGIGLISIEMALLSAFGVNFSIISISIWWLPVFAVGFLLGFKNRRAIFYKETQGKCISNLEKFFIFGISFQVLYAFFKTFIKPIEAYDAIAIYALKAKIFYIAKSIPQDFFTAFKDLVPHIEYPLLLPLAEAYIYTSLGSLNDLLVKIIFPVYYIASLILFYFAIKRYSERKTSLLFTFLLATIPQLNEYGTNGYSDILLTFNYSASFFYILLWMKLREGRFLALSIIFSILSIWTKSEGLMLAGVNLMVVIIYIFRKDAYIFKRGILYAAVSFVSMALYLYIRNILGLNIHSDFNTSDLYHPMNLALYIKRVPQILYEYQIQFFGPKKWNAVWVIFILYMILNFKNAFLKEGLRFMTLALIFIFSGYAFIYMMLPEGDISWHLSSTASRFFIHFLPIAILWIAVNFKEMKLEI